MNKKVSKTLLSTVLIGLVLSQQAVEACSAFIIGKGLTKDGSFLYGRTEDYPYPHEDGTQEHTHNKNFFVNPAKDYKEGDVLLDKSTGTVYPHLKHEYKYTVVADDSRDSNEGIFSEHGFNEHGVSMTATVTATPRSEVVGGKAPKVAADGRVLEGPENEVEYPAIDPLVKEGVTEAIVTDLILPRVKTAREAAQLLAKEIDEKGSAEGNIIVFADKNELWYMEIYSGHEYVAFKYPDDKYSVFPNTYFLGKVNINDKETIIASKGIIETAKKAGVFVGDESKGEIDLAATYAPPLERGDRSRVYAGIKLLNPSSKVTFQDKRYEFLQDSPRRDFTVIDGLNVQRNRFETLNGELVPDDQVPGYDTKKDPYRKPASKTDPNYGKYAYAPGNENVIDPHVYQINQKLPQSLGGVMWLSLGRSRNTPYVPYFGSIKDTFEAYKVRGNKYDANSWYWVATNIDTMVMDHPELFGKTIRSNWEKMEALLIDYQNKLIDEYTGKSDDYVKEHADEYTKNSIEVAKAVFQLMKDVEAKMEKAVKTKTPLASPFIDVSSLKAVLERLKPTTTPASPATPVQKQGFDGKNYYNKEGQKIIDKWVYDVTYQSWFFIDAKGEYVENQWVGDYYLKSGGYMAKSEWIQDEKSNTWYYVDSEGKYLNSTWVLVKGEWFYLDGRGAMRENQWVGDYYLKSGGYMAKSEWIQDEKSNTWYYVNSEGKYLSNTWEKVNNEWYYFNGTGKMLTGWVFLNGKWYYLEKSGAMKENQWFEVNGKWYYVDKSGELLVNTITPDGYYVNGNGEWV